MSESITLPLCQIQTVPQSRMRQPITRNRCGQQLGLTNPSRSCHPSQSLFPKLVQGSLEELPQLAKLLPMFHWGSHKGTSSPFLFKQTELVHTKESFFVSRVVDSLLSAVQCRE
jgi:hypothetical protein